MALFTANTIHATFFIEDTDVVYNIHTIHNSVNFFLLFKFPWINITKCMPLLIIKYRNKKSTMGLRNVMLTSMCAGYKFFVSLYKTLDRTFIFLKSMANEHVFMKLVLLGKKMKPLLILRCG